MGTKRAIRGIGNKRRGFTLIEIMVVVVVIGILATLVVGAIAGKDVQAQIAKARGDISTLTTSVESFRLNMGRYPYPEEGLAVLREPPNSDDAAKWKGPYVMRPIPMDPWSQPYIYHAPAPNGIDPFGIESLGPDRSPGGEGDNEDINSWTNYGEGDSGY